MYVGPKKLWTFIPAPKYLNLPTTNCWIRKKKLDAVLEQSLQLKKNEIYPIIVLATVLI